jgi:hypothetical protein
LREYYQNAYQKGYAGRRTGPYRITYALDLFNPSAPRQMSRDALDIMLRNLFEIDSLYLRYFPHTPLLYQSGVRYMEEPPGQEDWQDIPTTLRLGIADCEDLAVWRAAELNVRYGIAARPIFREQKRPNGSYLYHIQVLLPEGYNPRIEDPSRILGMR